MMIAGSILMGRVLSPIDQLIGVWKQWGSARLAFDRLSQMLEANPARPERMTLPVPKGQLSVEQISVSINRVIWLPEASTRSYTCSMYSASEHQQVNHRREQADVEEATFIGLEGGQGFVAGVAHLEILMGLSGQRRVDR
jgi:ABC-type multidrug transport system fused ATPase/permease subunit